MPEQKDNIIEFHQLSPWLAKIVATSQDPVVSSVDKMLQYCLTLDKQMPEEYGWCYTDIDTFKQQLKRQTDNPENMNKLYWGDMARNIEAYSITVYWRYI